MPLSSFWHCLCPREGSGPAGHSPGDSCGSRDRAGLPCSPSGINQGEERSGWSGLSPTQSQEKLSTSAKALGCLPRTWPCLSLSCTDTKPQQGTFPSLFEQVQPEPSLPTGTPGAFRGEKGQNLGSEGSCCPKKPELLPGKCWGSPTSALRHTRQFLTPKQKKKGTKIRNCEGNWHAEPSPGFADIWKGTHR